MQCTHDHNTPHLGWDVANQESFRMYNNLLTLITHIIAHILQGFRAPRLKNHAISYVLS
jgi:hypothetical protein